MDEPFNYFNILTSNSYSLDNKWSVVSENQTRFMVPTQTLVNKDPSKLPVFFNPAAKFNRDVSILIYRNYIDKSRKNNSFVDSMSASGARGLRVGMEVEGVNNIIFNDLNPFSIQITKINSVLNNIYNKCCFYNQEICKFLSNTFEYDKRGTIVDLDPFGTPAPYLDCVLRSVENGGLISITATDTAVLSGVYPKVCFRKYYGKPLRTKYSTEIGTRLLLSAIGLVASRMDLAIFPVFAHAYRNYIRVYCKVKKSNSFANIINENLGYIAHCFNCGNRIFSKGSNINKICDLCQKNLTIGGPLWISKIFDKELVFKILKDLSRSWEMANDDNSSRLRKKATAHPTQVMNSFFSITLNELDEIPFHFINDELGKILKCIVFSVNDIIEILNKNGYKSSKTIFSSNGFKTEASIQEIKSTMIKLI